jgi:prepilin-type N-terminal cleavage/methylation domain-containing protein
MLGMSSKACFLEKEINRRRLARGIEIKNSQSAMKNEISPAAPASAPCHGAKGFTLLELMVAVLLLAMVSTMIGSVLHAGINFSSQGEQRLLSMEREHGFLNLLRGQVRAAYFDERRRQVLISADAGILRLVTRAPLLNRGSGPVLAVYRYHEEEGRLYYLEKRDYYHLEYDRQYLPEFAEMRPLIKIGEPPMLAYDPDDGTVAIHFAGQEYEFFPKTGTGTRF